MKEKITPIEYLKSYLGVVDGEEFDVYKRNNMRNYYSPFHFEKDKLYDKDNEFSTFILNGLLIGDYTIKKRPFVPKNMEKYYFVDGDEIVNTRNTFNALDFALVKCGWAFRTREEAEANEERVLAEMKEVMGNDRA